MHSMTARRRDRHAPRIWLATVVLLGFGILPAGAQANGQTPTAEAYVPSTQVPTWLQGTWSREWLQEGKERSSTLDVHYLQTPTYFADIRILKDRHGISNARSFSDLTEEQLRLLAGQNGYAGRTTLAGTIATWHSDIAFRPSDGTPDKGRLERVSRDHVYEHGLDDSYIESWRFVTNGQGRFLVIRLEHSGRLLRTLVVLGNQFVYVRNRAKDLPRSPSFDALFKSTKVTREQIIDYLDCEFSAGRTEGGSAPWAIEQSTLPWREGHRLEFVDQVSTDDRGSIQTPSKAGEDEWTVPLNTFSLDEIKALFRRTP
jgi:hypothetical protein